MAKYIGSVMLLEAVQRHQIHLSVLVAETGLWANPEVHLRLIRESGSPALFPHIRRARAGQGEKRGQVVDGIRFDDNSYANLAIKRALGLHRHEAEGFEACHIWPRTCYDHRYHTAIANLFLLPRALAGLSDHDAEIQTALQFRAYELYGWHPETAPPPKKPAFYPIHWRDPEPTRVIAMDANRSLTMHPSADGARDMSPDERSLVIARVRDWASKPALKVHRIIGIVVRSVGGIARDQLVDEVACMTDSKNPDGAVASLLTSKANAYGRVFEDVAGLIRLHPAVESDVRAFRWF